MFVPGVAIDVSVPVVVAGGSREGDLDLLQKIAAAREVGAVGCSVGRNIFQHDEPASMVAAIAAVVRGTSSPEEALETHFKERVGI